VKIHFRIDTDGGIAAYPTKTEARAAVYAARRRFRVACNSRFDATGSIVCRDIAFKVARRTKVPVRALYPV